MDTCQQQGAALFYIENEEEQYNIASVLPDILNIGIIEIWLGISDSEIDGEFKLVTGLNLTFENWAQNQPQNTLHFTDCGVIFTGGGGEWMVGTCLYRTGYICKMKAGDEYTPLPESTDSIYCDEGWLKYDDNCYMFASQPTSWNSAKEECQALSASLVSIETEEEQGFIAGHMPGIIHIGLTDEIFEGSFGWIDGSTSNYRNWADGEPNNIYNEDCTQAWPSEDISLYGKWYDISCQYLYGGHVCKKPIYSMPQSTQQPPTVPATTPSPYCVDGWTYIEGTGACYRFVYENGRDWYSAREACRTMGGELASLTSSEEIRLLNDWISESSFANSVNYFWIGLTDEGTEGVWSWSNGSPVPYFNWMEGEPTYYFSEENCVEVFPSTFKWNDMNCMTVSNFMCKTEATLIQPTDGSIPQLSCHTSAEGWTGTVIAQCPEGCLPSTPTEGTWVIGTVIYADISYVCQAAAHAGVIDNEGGVVNVTIGPGQMQYEGSVANGIQSTALSGNLSERSFTFNEDGILACDDNSWTPGTVSCFKQFGETKTWDEARSHCLSISADLAVINSQHSQDIINALSDDQHCWIGLNDRAHEMQFQWASGSSVLFTKWAPYEPNNYGNDEGCVVTMGTDSSWNDDNCNSRKAFWCEKEKQRHAVPTSTESPDPSCPQGWYGIRESCYMIADTSAQWHEAQDHCLAFGSHLVDISDSVEQAGLTLQLYYVSGDYWTGLRADSTYAATGVTYGWSSGYPVTFTHWDSDQPDPSNNQYCGGILAEDDGSWFMANCTLYKKFICEQVMQGFTNPPLPPTTTEGPYEQPCHDGWIGYSRHCYQVNIRDRAERLTWSSAHSQCVHQNADLVSLHSPAEISWILPYLGQDHPEVGVSWFWIGLHYSVANDVHEWADGSVVYFTNWFDGEPNNYNFNEQCVEMSHENGKWNDITCSSIRNWICKIERGTIVAEPTATPTVDQYCDDEEQWILSEEGKCYKIGITPLTWQESRAMCLSEGAELVSLNSVSEHEFVYGQAAKLNSARIWIGLYQDNVNDPFEWSDGTPVTYINWAQGEPNNYLDMEECVNMFTAWGTWNDNHCSYVMSYICERSQGSEPWPQSTPEPLSGGCLDGWLSYSSRCFKIEGSVNVPWFTARNECLTMGADLASIRNHQEQGFLVSEMRDIAGYATGLWIGFNNMFGAFIWSDGTLATYTNFDRHEPNGHGQELSVEMYTTGTHVGKWNDEWRDNLRGYICAMDQDPSLPTEAPEIDERCPSGYRFYGNGCYGFVGGVKRSGSPMNWEDALSACMDVDSGASLASISNQYDQSFIEAMMYQQHDLWIGLNQKEVIGQFEWTNGEPVSYTHWAFGNPSTGNETRCVIIEQNGEWNLTVCSETHAALCKLTVDAAVTPAIPPSDPCPDGWLSYGQYCYWVVNGLTDHLATWIQSVQKCEELNSTIVSIQSYEENTFLVKSYESLNDNGHHWIGFHRGSPEAFFQWYDQSAISFFYWTPGEPSVHADEHCTEMYPDGPWNNRICSETAGYVCKRPKDIPGIPSTDVPVQGKTTTQKSALPTGGGRKQVPKTADSIVIISGVLSAVLVLVLVCLGVFAVYYFKVHKSGILWIRRNGQDDAVSFAIQPSSSNQHGIDMAKDEDIADTVN